MGKREGRLLRDSGAGQLFFVCIESAYLPYPTDVIFATSVPSSSVTTAV